MTQKYTIGELRSKLGVEPEQYQLMSNFKAKVLDKAVNQINRHTDIMVKYEQHKTGRTITAISFSFKQKRIIEHIASTDADNVIILSASQVSLFSNRLAALPELGSHAPMGASTAEYAAIIASELIDEGKQSKYLPYLAKVGYQSTKSKG